MGRRQTGSYERRHGDQRGANGRWQTHDGFSGLVWTRNEQRMLRSGTDKTESTLAHGADSQNANGASGTLKQQNRSTDSALRCISPRRFLLFNRFGRHNDRRRFL
jgi:hypothetical protein